MFNVTLKMKSLTKIQIYHLVFKYHLKFVTHNGPLCIHVNYPHSPQAKETARKIRTVYRDLLWNEQKKIGVVSKLENQG